jgi:DNA-binding MarR family transcriptional regulator
MATDVPTPVTSDLCWMLSRASHVLMTEMTAALEDLGISPREHAVLSTALAGVHTQSEIARLVGLDKTTMVVTVDELERAGLAERRADPDDRRARLIVVTPAGKRKVAEADKIKERVQSDVLSDLPERDRAALLRALSRLVAGRLAEPAECNPPLRRRTPRAS